MIMFNFFISMHACAVLSDSATTWTIACQASLSMRFPRQEYWSWFPFPPIRNLRDAGIHEPELVSPALQADS